MCQLVGGTKDTAATLVWVVVPVEATAGGARAMGAAAETATTAASVVINYWAATKEQTTRDLDVLSKSKGLMGIMTVNTPQEGKEGGQDMSRVIRKVTMLL